MSEKKTGRNPKFIEAALILVAIIVILLYCVIFRSTGAQIPLVLCVFVVGLFAAYLGYGLDEIMEMAYSGMRQGEMALLFNCMIGFIVASWTAAGIMPYIIYLGLGWISPAMLATIACVVCAIMSTLIGSSWTTAGTVGLAFVGIGIGMGMPAPLIAGAVISGSTFGDKLSPLSETTVVAAAAAKTPLMQHVHAMLYTSVPALVIGCIMYSVIGARYGSSAVDASQINEIRSVLATTFNFNPLLFLVPVVLVVMIIKKVDSLFCLCVAAILGTLIAVFYQGYNLSETASFLMNGLGESVTENAMVNSMLKKGGLNAMWFTISLIITAFPLAGLLQQTNILKTVVGKSSLILKSPTAAITASLVTPAVLCIITGASYVPAVLTAATYGDVYDDLELDRKVLSRSGEDTGTLFSPFVPWHGSGVYFSSTLGVPTLEYAPYYFLGWLDPLVALFCAFTGWGVFYTEGRRGWGKKNRYVKKDKQVSAN